MEYSLEQWKKEAVIMINSCRHSKAGSCVIACPSCKTFGFYAPRYAPTGNQEKDNNLEGRKYRGCKFCGFWQEVDNGEPYRCIALRCDTCGIDDWTQPKEEKDFKSCQKCHSKYKRGKWAIDNPEHIFWKERDKIYQIHGY